MTSKLMRRRVMDARNTGEEGKQRYLHAFDHLVRLFVSTF